MPTWITDLIPLAPWLVVLLVVGWLGFRIFPWMRKIMHFIDDVAGEPERPGVPARPGLMERVTTIESSLEQVRHEVTTNHGSSLKDAVKDIQSAVGDLADWQTKHEKKSDATVARVDRLEKEKS